MAGFGVYAKLEEKQKEASLLTREMLRGGFLTATLLFAISIAAGVYYSGTAGILVGHSLEGLREMAQASRSLAPETRALVLTIGIFLKNLSVVFLLLAVGHLLLAIPAVIVIVTNGLLLGFMGVLLGRQGVSIGAYILGLAPHGVIELPALLLAAGYALASFYLRFRNHKIPSFTQRMAFIARVLLPMLAAAAVVEVYITPHLLRQVIP